MHAAAFGLGLVVIAFMLWDAFETMLLPRHVPGSSRLSRLLVLGMWRVWSAVARRIRSRRARENFLSTFGWLAMLALLAMWALGLIVGFALLHWGLGSRLAVTEGARMSAFVADLYLSGSTLFTLGLGDVVPITIAARFLTVVECGMGFGFLALMLAYLPVLYQAFSRRESRITMLDEWAGSPPSGPAIVAAAYANGDPQQALDRLLREWEIVAAELLETQLSYPILAYFRSQHDDQSWLTALHAVLDACTVVIGGVRGLDAFQARHTFAICRHALVDVTQNLMRRRPGPAPPEEPAQLAPIHEWLVNAGVPCDDDDGARRRMAERRALYLPYVAMLRAYLLTPPALALPGKESRYNWRTTDRSLHTG